MSFVRSARGEEENVRRAIVIGEIAVDTSIPRGPEYRTSAAYLATCQAVSAKLAEALGSP